MNVSLQYVTVVAFSSDDILPDYKLGANGDFFDLPNNRKDDAPRYTVLCTFSSLFRRRECLHAGDELLLDYELETTSLPLWPADWNVDSPPGESYLYDNGDDDGNWPDDDDKWRLNSEVALNITVAKLS